MYASAVHMVQCDGFYLTLNVIKERNCVLRSKQLCVM